MIDAEEIPGVLLSLEVTSYSIPYVFILTSTGILILCHSTTYLRMIIAFSKAVNVQCATSPVEQRTRNSAYM
jgi:hypothetical protein